MTGRLESINISNGGVPKRSVFETLITEQGLAGDHQNDTRNQGGPDRAVVLYSLEVIHALQREGHPIAPAAVTSCASSRIGIQAGAVSVRGSCAAESCGRATRL